MKGSREVRPHTCRAATPRFGRYAAIATQLLKRRKHIMRRLLMASAIAALPFLAFGPPSALAVSPSQQQCEADGGTFDRTQGTASCTFTTEDPVGNSERSGGRSQTTTEEEKTSAKGNITPKQGETTSECVSGPGNSMNCNP